MPRPTEVLFALFLFACGPGPIAGSIGVVAKREGSTGRVIVVQVPPGGAGARTRGEHQQQDTERDRATSVRAGGC